MENKGKCANNRKKSITERPTEANGKRFGDWEMDLIVGTKRSAIPNYYRKEYEQDYIKKITTKL